jgi:hypothetical protein
VKIIGEVEIWKSARLAVALFGDRATARAQRRAADCESRADVDGWIKWMRIAETILEIERGTHR